MNPMGTNCQLNADEEGVQEGSLFSFLFVFFFVNFLNTAFKSNWTFFG